MTKDIIQTNEVTILEVEKCPVEYFGFQDFPVERVTTFSGGEKVCHYDIYMTETTRYMLSVYVEEKFRDGLWLKMIQTYEPGSLARFDRPKVVWLNTGGQFISSYEEILSSIQDMKNNEILNTEKIYSHGGINKIFKIN